MKKMIVGGLAVLAVAGLAGAANAEASYVLPAGPQEKFVSAPGVERSGANPNGDVTLTAAAYSGQIDAVCVRVGAAHEAGSNEAIAQALDQAIADVEALATPSSFVAFQERLVLLAKRQAGLIRSLADAQGADADALGAELEQVEVDIEDLFASQGGFEVCGQE